MRTRLTRTVTARCPGVLRCRRTGAGDRAAAATRTPTSSSRTRPTSTIPLEINVNRPAAEVWKRIGKYCDIGEWLQIPAGCKMLSGVEGEVGSVRSVATEVLVGKTAVCRIPTRRRVRAGRPYNLYHGTLEARPVTDKTSKIVYTLMYDNSMLPDDAAREKDKATRTATFQRAMTNMKMLAEGGTLAPRK